MNTCVSSLRRHHALLPLLMMLLPALLLGGSAGAEPVAHPAGSVEAGAPTVVSYQGVVTVTGSPYSGTGYFKFAVVDAAGTTSYWSNDGTSSGGGQPTASVALVVAGGQFTVLLGDTTLTGMTQALTPEAFTGTERYLRVWFSADGSAFTQLAPDTRIAAVPYALQAGGADVLDGYHATAFQQKYGGVVVVAKSGGDYSTVQAAINSITAASAVNPYLVWVAPGVYTETVTMKPYVHVQGAGQEATVIGSTVSGAAWPPQATVALTRSTSLRDVTVRNMSTAAGTSYRAAVLGRAGVTQTLVADVTAQTLGTGGSNTTNCGLALFGPGTSVTLQEVRVLAQNAEETYGLYNATGAAVTLVGGAYTARGGTTATSIYNTGSVTTLVADAVTVLGESGSGGNYALFSSDAAAVTLRGGAYTARGGVNAYSISISGSGSTLVADSVTVLGEGGTTNNRGLSGSGAAAATLRGGSYTARGGSNAYGVYSSGGGSTLVADGVAVLAENGSTSNRGVYNATGAATTLRGGEITARDGSTAYGVYSSGSGSTLEIDGVTVLAEGGTTNNYGVYGASATVVTLRGGEITARDGSTAYGVYNAGSGTALLAGHVLVVGESATATNYGLYNATGAEATLEGGTYTARGGTDTYGVYSTGSGTALVAEGVAVLGESTGDNHGLYNADGAVATLTGGAYTAREGSNAYGIYNDSDGTAGTTLVADEVTAFAENGSYLNYGLYNRDGAEATLRGGAYIARGGSGDDTYAAGIANFYSGTTLFADNVTALAEGAPNHNTGMVNGAVATLRGGSFIGHGGVASSGVGFMSSSGNPTTTITQSTIEGEGYSIRVASGSVDVSNSRLVGSTFLVAGSLTCTAVSRGTTFGTNTCP